MISTHRLLLTLTKFNRKKSSIKRREPTILKLANTYNDLCRQLANLIANGQAPPGSVVPQSIQRDGLFRLDVDDDIWQDVGLDDEYDGGIPLWLGDEGVRLGIQALLQHDRCCEEEVRLRKERCNLQQWFMEEWDCIKAARVAYGENLALSY
jgi:hypothetical protein